MYEHFTRQFSCSLRTHISAHLGDWQVAREGRPVADAELVAATAAELNAFAAAAAAVAAVAHASPAGPPPEAVEGPSYRGDLMNRRSGTSTLPGAPSLAGEGDLESAMALVETAGGPASPGPSGRLQCEAWRPLRLPALLVGSGDLHLSALLPIPVGQNRVCEAWQPLWLPSEILVGSCSSTSNGTRCFHLFETAHNLNTIWHTSQLFVLYNASLPHHNCLFCQAGTRALV